LVDFQCLSVLLVSFVVRYNIYIWVLGLWYLTPLSTIFQKFCSIFVINFCNNAHWPVLQFCPLLKQYIIYNFVISGTSLLLVGMLGMVIIFIYALVSFAILRERFLLSSLGRHCTTVYECFITVLHHGFVDSLYTVSLTKNRYIWSWGWGRILLLWISRWASSFFMVVSPDAKYLQKQWMWVKRLETFAFFYFHAFHVHKLLIVA